MTVGIDGGYVRAAHKEGCFEVIAGRSAAAQMLRLRADLRSEATEATLETDEIAGDARKSADRNSL
jgi:hypothetical protein